MERYSHSTCCGTYILGGFSEKMTVERARAQMKTHIQHKNMMGEATVTDDQIRKYPWIRPILEEFGFELKFRWRNPNSGNHCNFFVRSDAQDALENCPKTEMPIDKPASREAVKAGAVDPTLPVRIRYGDRDVPAEVNYYDDFHIRARATDFLRGGRGIDLTEAWYYTVSTGGWEGDASRATLYNPLAPAPRVLPADGWTPASNVRTTRGQRCRINSPRSRHHGSETIIESVSWAERCRTPLGRFEWSSVEVRR